MPLKDESMTPEEAIIALLAERGAEATICPSEAARSLAGAHGDWRAEMEKVHAAADALAARGIITLS